MKRTFKRLLACLLMVCTVLSTTANVWASEGLSTQSINATSVTLYNMGKRYEEVLTIPSNLPRTHQIKVSDKGQVWYYPISGSSVSVDDDGLVTPRSISNNLIETGVTVIRVDTLDGSYQVKVNVVDYAKLEAQKVMDAYLAKNITSGMTDLEKLKVITAFPAQYDYNGDPGYGSAEAMILLGKGGSCYASCFAIEYMCGKVGLKCRSVNAAALSGNPYSTHAAVCVLIGSKHYIAEAGYDEKAPRHSDVTPMQEVSKLFGVWEYKVQADGTAIITAYKGVPTVVSVPATITDSDTKQTYRVTAIQPGAFNAANITELTLPSTFTKLGANALELNMELKKVNLPSTITEIGAEAFSNCESLTSIQLPSGITAIPDKLFFKCISLTSLSVPAGVKSVGAEAFQACGKLPSITFNGNAPTFDENAFYGYPVNCTIYYPAGDATWKNVIGKSYGSFFDVKWATIGSKPSGGTTTGGTTTGGSTGTTTGTTTHTHSWDKGKVTKAPTVSAAGVKTYTCTTCKKTKTETVAKLKKNAVSVKNSSVKKTCSTKNQTFSLGAKATGGTLTYASSSKSVTVNSKGQVTVKAGFVGNATITVTASGSGYAKAAKKVTVTVIPTTPVLSGLKNSKSKKLTATWKKTASVTGYEVQCSTDKSFKKSVKKLNVKKNTQTSGDFTKLTKKKTYYVRVRSYKTVSDGKLYSAWSKSKSLKIKK